MVVDTDELKRRGWRQTAVSLPIFAALLFVPAGTLRYWQGWLYAFVFIAGCVVIGVYFTKHDPALVERRMKVGPTKEQEPAQKIIITLVLIGFLLLFVASGLDVRWHWSAVPAWLVIVANGMVGLAFVVFFVVLKQNSYAASTITVEPGQPVISTGVYGHRPPSDVCRRAAAGGLHAARARLLLGLAGHRRVPAGAGVAAIGRRKGLAPRFAGLRGLLPARCAIGSFPACGKPRPPGPANRNVSTPYAPCAVP